MADQINLKNKIKLYRNEIWQINSVVQFFYCCCIQTFTRHSLIASVLAKAKYSFFSFFFFALKNLQVTL